MICEVLLIKDSCASQRLKNELRITTLLYVHKTDDLIILMENLL